MLKIGAEKEKHLYIWTVLEVLCMQNLILMWGKTKMTGEKIYFDLGKECISAIVRDLSEGSLRPYLIELLGDSTELGLAKGSLVHVQKSVVNL